MAAHICFLHWSPVRLVTFIQASGKTENYSPNTLPLLKADEISQHPESRAVDSFSLRLRGIREARETTERAGVQRVTDAAASEVPGADWV